MLENAESSWIELPPVMFSMSQSPDAQNVESALVLFAQLAGALLDKFKPHLQLIHDMLASCLKHSQVDVRLAAISAVASFVEVPTLRIYLVARSFLSSPAG